MTWQKCLIWSAEADSSSSCKRLAALQDCIGWSHPSMRTCQIWFASVVQLQKPSLWAAEWSKFVSLHWPSLGYSSPCSFNTLSQTYWGHLPLHQSWWQAVQHHLSALHNKGNGSLHLWDAFCEWCSTDIAYWSWSATIGWSLVKWLQGLWGDH